MSDTNAVRVRLDVLVRLLAARLQSGEPTTAAIPSVQSAAAGMGLPDALITAAGRTVWVEHVADDGAAHSRMAVCRGLDALDCDASKRLDEVTKAIATGTLSAENAGAAIDAAQRQRRGWWWNAGGLAALSVCIVLQVGVPAKAAIVTALVQFAVSAMGALFGAVGLNRLFAVVAQCVTGGAVAALLHSAHALTWSEAAAAVAVTWTLLVPLPQIVGWVADAAGSEHLTALARASSVLLVVSGIVIGGALVIAGADRIGFEPAQHWELPTLAVPLGLLFAVLGAMANAVANGGGVDLLGPAAAIGLATAVCNQALIHVLNVPPAWAAAVAAALLGIGASLWSRRIPYPATVLALMGITGALLPGLTVYQGLAAELAHRSGVTAFATAGAVCFGLGVGVTFGMTLTDRVMAVRRR